MSKKWKKGNSRRSKIHKFWEEPVFWVTLVIVVVGIFLLATHRIQLPSQPGGNTAGTETTIIANPPPDNIVCSNLTTDILKDGILKTVNYQRLNEGHNSVTLNDSLCVLASEHCIDMAKRGEAFAIVNDEVHYRCIWYYKPEVCNPVAISEAFINDNCNKYKVFYPYAKQVGLAVAYSNINHSLYVVWIINKDDVQLTDRRHIETLPQICIQSLPRQY